MSYNGSGTFQINSTGQPVVTGTVISSTAFNALTADLATGLSTAITKDGQTTTTVRIPFAQGVSSTLTTDATSATTGSIITAGGISTQKALWVGTTSRLVGAVTADAGVSSTLTTDATSATTGSIITAGGISCQKAAVVGTSLTFNGFAAEGTVTAAPTTDLSTSIANRQSVTGNTTITSFGSGANYYRILRFTGTPLLTYNATSLITPTGANIQAAAGDVATLSSDGSGNWRIISYTPVGGSLSASATGLTTSGGYLQGATVSPGPGTWEISAMFAYSGSGGAQSILAVSTTTASAAGTVTGKSLALGAVNAAAGAGGCSVPPFDVTLTTTTPYYANYYTDGGGGASCSVSIRARRIF